MSAVLGRGRVGPAGEADDLMSFAEIGRRLGVSSQSIEKSYHAALRKLEGSDILAQLLREQEPDNEWLP